jgi:hypothetical protein
MSVLKCLLKTEKETPAELLMSGIDKRKGTRACSINSEGAERANGNGHIATTTTIQT